MSSTGEVGVVVDTPVVDAEVDVDIDVSVGDDDYITLVEVLWRKDEALWFIEGHYKESDEVKGFTTHHTKEEAKREAIRLCKSMASPDRTLELQIKNKDGKIGKGDDAKRSYGRESKAKG